MPSYGTTATGSKTSASRESFCGSTAFILEFALYLAERNRKFEIFSQGKYPARATFSDRIQEAT
jgi:hypothetical protein